MKKNIDLVIDGIAPEKVMYDTDNHSLVVLYPVQRKFKRGDVLKSKGSDAIFILDAISPKHEDEEWCSSIIGLNFQGRLVQKDTYCWGSIHDARLATPEEQQILFDALKKEGKKWNAEKLEIENLDISEIAVGLVSACEYLNRSIPKNYIYDAETKFEKQINAQIELQLIREAWNKFDGFEVDYSNSEQDKYFPVLDAYGHIKHLVSRSYLHINSSCYSFKTKERALQFGNQFKGLFKTALGI